MNFDARTLTTLTRAAQPDTLSGLGGHLDDAECDLLLQRLLTAPRDGKETARSPGQTRWHWLGVGGSVVGGAVAVLIAVLIAVSGHDTAGGGTKAAVPASGRGPSARHHTEPFPTRVETIADIGADTSRAVQRASHTGILQATSSIGRRGGTTVPTTKSWSDLSNREAVRETVDPNGHPELVMVQDSSGVVEVISYKDRAWWIAPSFPGPNGETLRPTIETAQDQVQDLEAALAKGTMQIIARDQTVDGQITIELAGSELPSALGEHLTIWLNQSTYLPVLARSVDSVPNPVAPSGGLETDTTYQWLPPTAANIAQLTPNVPPGFTRLSNPPSGSG